MGNNEQVLFPVWSEKEFAELCKWDNYQPNSIPLDDFIEKLLPKFTTVQRNYPIGSVDLNRNHSSDVLV